MIENYILRVYTTMILSPVSRKKEVRTAGYLYCHYILISLLGNFIHSSYPCRNIIKVQLKPRKQSLYLSQSLKPWALSDS